MATEPHKREAQIRLAEEVTLRSRRKSLTGTKENYKRTLHGNVQQLTADEIEQKLQNMPTFESSKEMKPSNMACGPWYRTIKENNHADIQNGAFYQQ